MRRLLLLLVFLACPALLPAQDIDPVSPGSPAVTGETDTQGQEDDFFVFDEEETLLVSDPLQPLNRGIFWFNDKLYFYLLKPVARGYRWLAPEPIRIGVQNFFSNLATPVRLVNSGLQLKFRDAGNELTRFVVNTTLGIGGLYDPAKEHFNLRKKDEDTGQTLGHYGIGTGIYIVLPALGPSNIRDGVGLLADSYLDLTRYAWENQDYYGARALDIINGLSIDKDTYEGIKKDALDPYLFIRDAYMQYRDNKVKN